MTQFVDWTSQWESFAENFFDGKAHIDLARFGGQSVLQLLPGPGFGDLSHPTTNLMLQLMQNKVRGRGVLDIGCGSGILGLSALKLGAVSSFGVDIDPEAIEHAKQNCKLNHLKAKFGFTVPTGYPSRQILLMNMIFSEQKTVMQQKDRLNAFADIWITSGILARERTAYYALTKEWNWKLKEEIEQGEWIGMVFEKHSP